MTPDLTIEINNAGMTPGLIDDIIDLATVAANADVFQESTKEDYDGCLYQLVWTL